MTPSLCLNMIVKNESHVIKDTLANLCNYFEFSYWVICDTGSTDGTQQIIRDFFGEKGISGELLEHEWRDFGHNRSLALAAAYDKTDYLLVFDADDRIVGDFKLPVDMTADSYDIKIGRDFTYKRTLIVNNRKKWCFKGVLHEYISCLEQSSASVDVAGNYYMESGRIGNRSSDPLKYLKDATILEKAYESEMDTCLKERYAFYCAQSYKDCGNFEKAIEWYKKVLTLNNWIQEKYYSSYMIGNLYKQLNNMEQATTYWLKTSEYDSERIEGIVDLCEYYRSIGSNLLVNLLYHKFKGYTKHPSNKLFVFNDKYNDILEYNNSICAYYVNDRRSGYECCKQILKNKVAPSNIISQTENNMNFYKDFVKSDTDVVVENTNIIQEHNIKNDEPFKFPLKIVNLERRLDRKQSTVEEFKKHRMLIDDRHFFKAVDGKQIKLTDKLYNIFKGNCFNYKPGTIGCALSHYYLWKQLAEEDIVDYYLIMEDDCKLDPNFESIMCKYEEIFKNNNEPNLFYLGYSQYKRKQPNGNFSIKKFVKDGNFVGGTFCYVINKNAARKFSDFIELNGIKREIDVLMHWYVGGINLYELDNHIAHTEWVRRNEPGQTIDSDIQYDKDMIEVDTELINNHFKFYEHMDQCGNDLYYRPGSLNQLLINALDDKTVLSVNHEGYFKNKIDTLEESAHFKGKGNGIYIKVEHVKELLMDVNLNRKSDLKVAYLNFWPQSQNNIQDWWLSEFIKHNISPDCELVNYDKNPDILIASCFGDIKNVEQTKAKCKIFFYGENLNTFTPYNNQELLKNTFDIIVGFKETNLSEKQVHLPLWVMYYPFYKYDYKNNVLTHIQDAYNKNIQNSDRQHVASLVASHDINGIRTLIYNEVKHHIDVLCPGNLFRNIDPIGDTCSDKINFISKTRFNICPENSEFEGYYTEKIFQSLEAGCIPFYWAIDKPEPKILNEDCYCWVDPKNLEQTKERISDTINNHKKHYVSSLFKDTAQNEIKQIYETLKNEFLKRI